MEMISEWSRFAVTFSGVFVVVGTLLLFPWRKPLRTMLLTATLCIAVYLPLSLYCYFFTSFPLDIFWYALIAAWVFLVFLFVQYRDARTIFGLLSVLVLNVSAALLVICCVQFVPSFPLRILILLFVHSIFCLGIYRFLREPYLAATRLGKKGWLSFCFLPILLFSCLQLLAAYPSPLSLRPEDIPGVSAVCLTVTVVSLAAGRIMERLLEQKRQARLLSEMALQMKNTEKELREVAQRESQNAIFRHDMRHFASLISHSIDEHLYDEALSGVQGLLNHPAMREPEKRFCKNPVLNTLLSSFDQKAVGLKISFQAVASLNESLGIDVMELAVMLSNVLENAFNACSALPESEERAVRVKLHMAGEQIYVNVSNTCKGKVPLDGENGLPLATPREGHGIGLLSVKAFAEKYHAQIDCVQENNWFQLRLVASDVTPSKVKPPPKRRSRNSVLWVNIGVSGLIVAGFALTGLFSFQSFEKLFKTDIQFVSELTSENIYANLNNLMDRPLNVSLAMAHDTLLQELMTREAASGVNPKTTKTIQSYLASYQEKYGFDSVFLVSTTTGAYYHYQSGVSRIVSPENPEDVWYYDYMKEDTLECKLNIDNNKAKDYSVTIFVDCKLKDDNGKILGVVGVGMETPYIRKLMAESEERYDLHAYLIDSKGDIQLSSELTKLERVNLFENKLFEGMQEAIVNNQISQEQKWYSDGRVDGYIITKYIPNLNWYLVVEKTTAEFQSLMLRQFLTGLLFMLIVVVVVVLITNSILRRYHHVLVGQAEKDPLTGLRNRACYEQEMQVYEHRLADYTQFGIGIFDLNNFKRTNDVMGHQAGDEYLRTFSALLCEAFPHSPAFRIGGDEFLVVFLNIGEEEVKEKWELLRRMLAYHSKESAIPTSAAFGYAFRDMDTLTDTAKIFKEADHRMYQDKEEHKRNESEPLQAN